MKCGYSIKEMRTLQEYDEFCKSGFPNVAHAKRMLGQYVFLRINLVDICISVYWTNHLHFLFYEKIFSMFLAHES